MPKHDLDGERNHPDWQTQAREHAVGGASAHFHADDLGRGGYRRDWREGEDSSERGLRSYQKQEDRIRMEIHQALTEHPGIDAANIDISIDSGVVVLRGIIDDRRQRCLALKLAEEVPGVREVRNELKIESPTERDVTMHGFHDLEIAKNT